jgi:integrase/recombinase XerD
VTPVHRDDHREDAGSGPLAGLEPGFAAYLASLGHSRPSVTHHLRWMAELSAWLGSEKLTCAELTAEVARRFRAMLRARGSYLWHAVSVQPLLDYLRSLGLVPPPPPGHPAGEAGVLLGEYERYLREERQVSRKTAGQYLRYAARFLDALGDRAGAGGLDAHLAALDGAHVLDVVSQQAGACRPCSLGPLMTGDRALLRFLLQAGKITRPLASAVPLAATRPSRLPARVDPAAASAILASCDRTTEVGCRDYAVLVLLHRYGLRPVEISRLQLDDLRWRQGEFVVRGKASRVDVLPLLPDAGEAIVAYLQIRRSAPAGTSAVFLAARAPVQPMGISSVGGIISRACSRAGLPRTGPRAFRHAAGHDMLAGGASLTEIRDVLRHRDIATTSAYTRVEVSALRPLARPWPGCEQARRPAGTDR